METGVFEATEQVEQQLKREFRDRVPEATLRRQAAESLARFEGARITTFVPLLAVRHARSRLRRDLHTDRQAA